MDRIYFFFLGFLIVKEFLKCTPVMLDLYAFMLQGFAVIAPQMSLGLAKLIFNLVMNLPLLIVIPAIYVIIAEMKTKRERIIGVILLILGWFYSMYMWKWSDTFMFRVMLVIVATKMAKPLSPPP